MIDEVAKLGVLFFGRKRPGFDTEWGRRVEGAAREFFEGLPNDYFVPEKVVDDSSLRGALHRCAEANCDVLVVLQTTMSDGSLAPILAQQWAAPVVLWATPERPDGGKVSSCSLVGTHIFASTLRQLRRPFELVYGSPDDPQMRKKLGEAIRVAHVTKRLARAKIGLVGYHAPGFMDMHADPYDLNAAFGVQLRHLGLQELVDLAGEIPEAEVREDTRRVLEMGLPLEDVLAEDLPTDSRMYLGMKRILEGENLDALAVREWPELPNVMGQWPYLAMLRLTMEGMPVAMEGDTDGALSSLVAQMLGLGSTYLSDWLEHDEATITLWHMGNAPLEMCEPVGSEYGPRLAKHFNVPKPFVVNANLKPDQRITLFRLWRCDGRYHMMACDAETVAPRRPLKGTNGLARVGDRDVYEWFEMLCHAGMPHHVAVVKGHHQKLLQRFARQVCVEWVA